MNRQQRITHARLWPMLGLALLLGLLLALGARRARSVEPERANKSSVTPTTAPTGDAP